MFGYKYSDIPSSKYHLNKASLGYRLQVSADKKGTQETIGLGSLTLM